MNGSQSRPPVNRQLLLEYFMGGATPRSRWQVGMEVEKMGRDAATGRPLPYEGGSPSVRAVLEYIREARGADPVLEGHHLIGLDAPWGSMSLEPGGQVEWSSRPRSQLGELRADLLRHLEVLHRAGDELGVRWLELALDPVHPVEQMPWMPKARYAIMRDYLGRRGRLAHRMMTQTTSIQCAFDYASHEDWRRKFTIAALMAPLAVALFANSSVLEGRDSGWRCFRQAIWRETDPDRCGLPAVVFEPDFDMERWLDWLLDVPTIFRQRARGLVPTGGLPFRALLARTGCDALKSGDWETHASTIFTEVRSYTYIEVRSADLQPDALAFAVPSWWTGLLYQDEALDRARELCGGFATHAGWDEAMRVAGRDGLDGKIAGRSLRELCTDGLRIARHGLEHGAACVGDPAAAVADLRALAAARDIDWGQV